MKINVLSIQIKKVNARYTKHQVHFGINCAISVMISTLIDIIFVLLKTEEALSIIIKCSQDLKCSVFLPHGTFV